MPSKLDQLKAMTVVVADTAEIEAIKRYKPTDCTTNPSLILKAAQGPASHELVDQAVLWGSSRNALPSVVADRLVIDFGAELAELVPGRISTEVDADLSFDTEGTVARARAIVRDYDTRGIGRDRILIKIAATWEGIRAAGILQREGTDCNMTLVFSLAQAIACADAGAFLISPFVGRILDWHVQHEGKTYTPESDPGVASVRVIYDYYKGHNVPTVIMGASFRSVGEVEALAGCDRLTISPPLLEALAADDGELIRRLDPAGAAERASARIAVDEKTFRLMLNEDAMASEKLAAGIRDFARDLRLLRELLAARLEVAA